MIGKIRMNNNRYFSRYYFILKFHHKQILNFINKKTSDDYLIAELIDTNCPFKPININTINVKLKSNYKSDISYMTKCIDYNTNQYIDCIITFPNYKINNLEIQFEDYFEVELQQGCDDDEIFNVILKEKI